MKYFESRTYGEVLSRITNDVDTLGMGLNQSITTIITAVATMLGVLVMMLSISPLMTLIAVIILPVSAGLISFVVKKSQKYFKTQQELSSLTKPIRYCINPHGNRSSYPE